MKAASEMKTLDRTYKLPGTSTEINLSTQLLKCPELMFQPAAH